MSNTQYPIPNTQSRAFTVERAAYVAIGLLAAVLRLYRLGLRPLNEAEATQALAAYRFVRGAIEAAPGGTIPALFTGNVAGFTLLGAGDAVARWLPALAGLVLVLLPYFLRHRLGRGGALAASLLLALSPSAVFFSRSLDGAILVAASGLALAVGLIQYLDTRRPAWLYLAAGALGFGLCAGPAIFGLLLIFLAFGLLLFVAEKLLDRETGWSSLRVGWWALRAEPGDEGGPGLPTKLAAVLGGTFGLVAMTFALHPAGVGLAADTVAAWAQGFLPETGGAPAVYPLLLLLRYEPLLLLLGLVAMGRRAWAARRGQPEPQQAGSAFPHAAFLAFWALAATLLAVVAGHNVLLGVVPLALLAGQSVERAWQWLDRRARWPEVGLVAAAALVLVVFLYLQVATYGLADNTTTISFLGLTLYASSTYLILAGLALSLIVGLGIVAWAWRGPGVVLGGAWLALLLVLGLYGVRQMWGANVARAADPRELLVAQTTSPQVRTLVAELEQLSVNESGAFHTLPVTVEAATGPVIAWYLREFEQQVVVEELPAPPQTVAALTLAHQDLPIGETYRGQGFALRVRWAPWGLWGRKLSRWLLFGEGDQPIVDRQVVLWVASGE